MTTLQHYFKLRFTMLKRHLSEFGINPVAGMLLLPAVFYTLSYYLFLKPAYAGYIYVFVALSIVLQYAESRRNDFLKLVFSIPDYYRIRIGENLATVSPFVAFLLFKQTFLLTVLLILLSACLALIPSGRQTSLSIPTPFYKKPFEFITGFRTWFAAIILAYLLTAISLLYQNFNLGIFSLLFLFLVCLAFYNEPEDEFYVWIHRLKTNAFLFDKIKTAILFSTLLSLPVTALLLIFFTSYSLVILGFQLLGYLYLITMILAKYSAWPQKMNLPQSILLTLGIVLPPLLLVIVPYFYFQSHKRLKDILG